MYRSSDEMEKYIHFSVFRVSEAHPNKWHSPRMELYCIMRNIILALWFFNHKAREQTSEYDNIMIPASVLYWHCGFILCFILQEFLTVEKCIEALCLRGITRIWCIERIPRVHRFLSEHAHINIGIMKNVARPLPFPNIDGRGTVLVVGAGASGLSAAYHLRNHGYQVNITRVCKVLQM